VATAYFVDSSALVKRYVRETGTAWVRGITRRRSSTDIIITLITAVEVTSAIARRRGVTLSFASTWPGATSPRRSRPPW
jgi:predicted nucleic acid-binding protein